MADKSSSDEVLFHSCLYQGPKAFISQSTCPWILDASKAKNLDEDGILSEYQFQGKVPVESQL